MHFKCDINCARWIVFFGIFIPTLAYGLCDVKCNETSVITAFLDSTVILPCSFDNGTRDPVLWRVEAASEPCKELLQINSSSKVSFTRHMMGRVVVFPNLYERGNFSIRIDRFQSHDVGTYCCVWAKDKCRRLKVEQGRQASPVPDEEEKTEGGLPKGIYIISAATVVLIGLIIACFYILKKKWICMNRVEYYVNHTNGPDKGNIPASTRASAPPHPSHPPHPHGQPVTQVNNPQERGASENNLHERYPARQNNPHQKGGDIIIPHQGFSYLTNNTQRGEIIVHRTDSVVYENAEHDPEHQQQGRSLQVHFQKDVRNSPRNRVSFVDQPNYANQSEINKVDKRIKEAKRRGQNYEFQNPLYSNSNECLIHDDG